MSLILPKISDEQRYAIEQLNTNNIIVDSVAGCGKTTTNLYIALTFPNQNILLLTYNRRLKEETRNKVNNLNINNLEVHSYHSFCVKYYNNNGNTDNGIKDTIKFNTISRKLFKYDIILLDEAQDICPLYYELICKIIKDNNRNIKICILGDKYQSIYDFNKADNRFIIHADKLFNFNNFNWESVKLSESFRITQQNALFINNCLLKEDRLISNKKGDLPRYIICNTFDANEIYYEIKYYIDIGYDYEDIFILAPSVKSEKSPVRVLANKLTSLDIDIYIPSNDDEKIDEQILEGKLVFSTFHQTKGLERKVIIIYSFENSYFEYYKKNISRSICPNEIYVACTRSLEQLTLLHHNENDYMEFIDKKKLKEYCYCQGKIKYLKSANSNKYSLSVSDLIKHLAFDDMNKALNYLDKSIKNEKSKDKITICFKQKQKNNKYEGVAEITGIAVPAYFEYKNTGKMAIYEEKEKVLSNNSMFSDVDIKIDNEDRFANIKLSTITIEELLYISNKWNAKKNGVSFKLRQINNYDWLSNEHLNKAIIRLDKYISKNAIFEKGFKIEGEKELHNKTLTGYFDCIDNNNIWEFKCVDKLEDIHILQLGCYMYQFLKTIYNTYLNEKQKIINEKNILMNQLENIDNNVSENDIKVDDKVDFKFNGKIYYNGFINKIFKNGYINIICKGDSRKVKPQNIIKNYTALLRDKNENNYDTNILKINKEYDNKLSILEQNTINKEYHFYLFNIFNEEIIEIKSDIKRLENMIEFLINIKNNNIKIDDNKFINENLGIAKKYF